MNFGTGLENSLDIADVVNLLRMHMIIRGVTKCPTKPLLPLSFANAQAPFVRFVVDLLCNKSAANRTSGV